MVDVFWSRREIGPEVYQNLIFIGDMSFIVSGYGLCNCPKNDYHVVLCSGRLQDLADDIINDRKSLAVTIEDALVFPIHREIDRLENEQSTSRGLTREVRKLLEILPEPSPN